jgi:Flp pilus assembly protein TadB
VSAVLDDRERGELEEIERALLADAELQRRLRAPGARLRGRLATPVLAAMVVFLVLAATGVLLLGLPVHAIVVALLAWWPWRALRRRHGRHR